MENSVRKREWVKTAAIIFLAVLLVLTFFSKTIMNASLPEVAAQQAASGAINARIRGSGTVEASEVYNVTIKQTRKVASVLVKTGQEINVGDTMFVLEAEDSDELKQAETDLETLQQNYDKSLIEAGNTAAQENYDVQKARDAYNEALAIYRQYSTMDASQLATQKAAAEAKLKELQTAKTTVDNQITKLKADTQYTEAQAVVTAQDAIIKAQQEEKNKLLQTLTDVYPEISGADGIRDDIEARKIKYVSELAQWDSVFLDLVEKCDKDYRIIDECFKNYVPGAPSSALLARINGSKTSESDYYSAYLALMECYYGKLGTNGERSGGLYGMQNELQLAVINDEIKKAEQAKGNSKTIVDNFERSIDDLTKQSDSLDAQINDQQAAVDKLSSAASAAETVKSTKQALEDIIFKQNLGDSSSVDMEASKKAIERKQAEVDKLRENADELEVKSSVSGTIASINASAGKSIGGEEQPLATINVTDRGFTVKIDVTNDQAKKVKTGDTAELVNFWGGDAVATLDQITSSQTAGNRTLVFTLTGDIQAGQNVTLSIGQKSANYDALIPLSGLREDSNGKFVYVLESKSSPLGSRYIATRVTVQELARDDKSAAVSGISSGDFIITTSNKPIEAGKQVRLADNG
jgi:multidrug efflux pump subunit AcrA (membrane-fusion protein)